MPRALTKPPTINQDLAEEFVDGQYSGTRDDTDVGTAGLLLNRDHISDFPTFFWRWDGTRGGVEDVGGHTPVLFGVILLTMKMVTTENSFYLIKGMRCGYLLFRCGAGVMRWDGRGHIGLNLNDGQFQELHVIGAFFVALNLGLLLEVF